MKKGVDLEYAYAEDTMPRGVLVPERHDVQGVPALHRQPPLPADRRRRAVRQGRQPFPWMAEMIDLKKEKNFFETRVTEYQTRRVVLD